MTDTSPSPDPRNVVVQAVIVEGGLAILAAGIGWFLSAPPLWMVRLNGTGVLLGAAWAVPMVAGGYLLLRFPPRFFQPLVELMEGYVAPMFRGCTVAELAAICALAGLGEEMLFRGVIQRGLADWIGGSTGLWVGLLASSVLFGAAHALTRWYAVLAGAMGFYLGWAWIASDNLLVPVLAHGLYDFVALVYLARIREPAKHGEP